MGGQLREPARARVRLAPLLRDEPDRVEPDRDEPDRVEPDRDEPDRDEAERDEPDRDDVDRDAVDRVRLPEPVLRLLVRDRDALVDRLERERRPVVR